MESGLESGKLANSKPILSQSQTLPLVPVGRQNWFSRWVFVLVGWAAVMMNHILGGLNTDIPGLTFLKVGRLRSKCWQGWFF